VLAGPSPSSLVAVASAPKTGFETAIATPASVTGGYVAVQALAGSGAVLGTSRTIKAERPPQPRAVSGRPSRPRAGR